jgi:GH35 family endo-1,4-beta-xylanase
VNAYFQENNNIVINVYATDLGKSLYNGHVTEVEFYVGDSIIGKSTIHKNNTFSITWKNVPQGEYIITAKATNNRGISFTSAGVIITVGEDEVPAIGLSSNKGKYLGNITGSAGTYDYLNYWNGVTAENACKWGSIERTRDVMNWGGADGSYNLAKNNHLMYRYHAIAWGSQYPSWIVDLTPEEFQEEIEEYMDTIAKRYPLMDQIDVLNENMNLTTWNGEEHAAGTPYFRAGMGGPGETGYDWAIWLFEKAREHFPNSKLVMNDYGLENSPNSIREMLDVVKVLRDRGLIDGFGTQAHTFNVDGFRTSPNTLRQRVDLMATSGIPVYVTELDLTGNSNNAGSEDLQLESYKNILPVYWEHPAVAGVTLWGYVSGATWRAGTGLLDVQTDGTRKDRKAMLWIKEYFGTMENVGYPFGVPEPYIPPVDTTDTTTNIDIIANHELIIFPNPTDGKINIQANNEIKKIDVIDINGKKIKSIKTKNILGKELDITDLEEGNYILNVYTKSKNYSYKILKK